MKIQTVSYMKEHANHMELDEPVLVTQNGKPKFVLQDAAEYEQQQETISLLKLINLSERSGVKGRLMSMDDAFDI